MMPNDGALLDPLLDTRDVVETYLGSHRELPDWQETLKAASGRLTDLAKDQGSAELGQMAKQIDDLAESGMRGQGMALHSVSAQVAKLLNTIRVPGLPRTDDQDWSF